MWEQRCGGHAANAAKRDTGPNLRALKLTEIHNVFILSLLYASYAPCVYHIASSQSLKNIVLNIVQHISAYDCGIVQLILGSV